MKLLTKTTRMWLTKSVKPFTFTNQYDNKLNYENINNLGLYVHIPFCKTLCSFCPYCKVKYDTELANKYVKSLIKEIELVSNSNIKKEVTSLYFGGGSPALLANDLKLIINTLKKHYVITEGIGVELHPSDVNIQTLTILKDAGITKISIGIQSFQHQFAKLLNRPTPNYLDIFEMLKQVPFETVSMDFIFALPNQTFDDIKKDIDLAFNYGANHIALYPFIEFTYIKTKIKKMSNKQKRILLNKITDYLINNGYIRDSIWTFAKSNKKTLNAKYSSMTRDNFLGFGASATTLLEKQFKINTFDIESYVNRVEQNKLPTALTIYFTLRQRMLYYLFWTTYTTKVNSNDFYNFYNIKLEKVFGLEFYLARKLGFITKTKNNKNNTYTLTKKGVFYYHYFEGFYTLAYIDKMWNIMKNNPFPQQLKL